MWKFTPQNSKKEKCRRWVNTPIMRRGSEDMYKLRRDYIVIYFYPSPLQIQIKMYPCGEQRDCKNLQELRDALDEIRSISTQKAKTICFVQHLDVLVKANAFGDVKWIGSARQENESSYHFCAIDTYFEYRNLDPILDTDTEHVFCCDDIMNIIGSYGVPLYKIVWSLGYITKKILFDPELREELWEETKKNKRYFNDIDTYRDMFAGSSSGFLWLDKNYQKQILEDVSSFDIISAYNWVLVTDNHFPLTMPKRTRNIEDIIRAIEKDDWFLITLQGYDLGKNFDVFMAKLPEKSKPEDFSYAWDCYGYKTACLLGIDMSEIIENYPCHLYTAKKRGYLNKKFRDKLVGVFNHKESFDDKEHPERKIAKKQLEITYGKGMQDYEFNDIKQVIDHYSHKGQNYILPHWSKMCVSAIKYRIVKSYFEDAGIIYCDTDGIKTKLDPQTAYNYYIGNLNKQVKKINKKAGYPDSKLGYWKYEWTAKRFVMISKKQYCAEQQNGDIDATLSGVPKKDVPEYINKYDDFLKTLIDGMEVTKHRLVYVKEKDEFVYEPYNVIVGKEDQNECNEHES